MSSEGGGNAQDLIVDIMLVSSLLDIPVRSNTVFVGEIGLLGELMFVQSLDIREARRMSLVVLLPP